MERLSQTFFNFPAPSLNDIDIHHFSLDTSERRPVPARYSAAIEVAGGRHGENLVDFLHPGLEDGLYCLGAFMDIEGVDTHGFLDGEDFLAPVLDGV